jgi:hypothetical protein
VKYLDLTPSLILPALLHNLPSLKCLILGRKQLQTEEIAMIVEKQDKVKFAERVCCMVSKMTQDSWYKKGNRFTNTPSQATPSTSSPPHTLTPLSDLESFPPSPAKQPPAIPTAVLPKPVPVVHKKAKPVPRPKPVPKAKPVPKPWSNTHISTRLSAGVIQVEEPTNKAGDAGILDVNAPVPPKKKPVACHGKKAA